MDARLDYLEVLEKTAVTKPATALPSVVINAKSRFCPTKAAALKIPPYLSDVYDWAYLNPRNVKALDREFVVWVILWGQHRRLERAAFGEISPGARVLQPAAVYGDFSPTLARHIGPQGQLDVIDIAPIQVASSRRKLMGVQHASARLGDARIARPDQYDAACCYFLLHEVPDEDKREVVDALLASVVPGGKVVFIDYHKPHWAHPLKLITSTVFDTLEPFAKSLWRHEIADFATKPDDFTWRQQSFFGGLFQKVVAERRR